MSAGSTSATPSPPAIASPAPLSLSRRLVATLGVMLATMCTALDTTIANVALPHMQGSLSASPEQMLWVLTSYIVAGAIMTPLSGWLAEKIGRKQMFLWSMGGFVASSMLCGVAANLSQIVVFRVLQGIAGASLMPLSQAALLDMWPRDKVAQVMAVWSAVTTSAPVAGPTVGGWLTDNLSWRWAFFINLPLGIISFLFVVFAIPADPGGRQRRFDYIGFIGLAMAIVGFQLVLDRGPLLDWFDSTEIRIEATVAAIGFYLFVVQMFTARVPFVPRGIIADRNFTSCLAFVLVMTMVLFASATMTPTMMQRLLGYTALHSGNVTAPRGIGGVVGFMLAPRAAQMFGPRRTMALGISLMTFAFWSMTGFSLDMDDGPIRLYGFILGLGSSLLFNPMAVLTYATLPGHFRNEAAVFSGTVRNIGASAGIAVSAYALTVKLVDAQTGLARHISPTDVVFAWRMPGFDAASGVLSGLDAEVVRQAGMISYNIVYGYLGLLSVAMLVPLVLLRPMKPGAGPRQPEVSAH